ncbi:RidA family protein [Gynurincola endophyticus]|uniref:RidA family protein n=1 Tax=Gynurincola endophyticus TaxID=2479004 RepID=UPI0018F5CF3A|nr:RidA family protein [Gynurincola endophyticus]
MSKIDAKLQELGYSLLEMPPSKGLFKRCLTVGNLLYVSGHVSIANDGTPIQGKIGADLSLEEGKAAARQCALGIISSVKEHIGDLDKVKQLVKLLVLVNCPTDYTQHPIVANGCSELFAEVFGTEAGIGTRSAFGAGSLPNNVAVEVEAVFEL